MKKIFLFSSFVIALFLFSCSNEDNEVFVVQDELKEPKDSIFIYDMFFESAIIPFDGTTRASMATNWEDGDVVFIHFQGTNDSYGQAVYIKASKKWRVTCEKELIETSNDSCSFWFGKGDNLLDERYFDDDYLYDYSYLSEVYSTSSGQYTFGNGGIYANAIMQPKGWRLRFKGTVGTEIQVSSQWWSIINGIFRNREFFYSGTNCCSLVVGTNGYTDYFVAQDSRAWNPSSDISITNITTGECFTRYFDRNTLKEGESGCFTIPTSTDLHGWTMASSSSTINGQEYVDLGLPSGTLWATRNIGARSPEAYGCYFAWGETKEKDYYGWDTYFYCDGTQNSCYNIGDNIAGTEYDVAHLWWGGTWQMPSLDQIKELIDNCSRKWMKQNDVNGILVTGPNGNTIFFPAAGNSRLSDYNYLGVHGGYWSSSPYTNVKGFSYYFYFDSSNWNWDNQYNYRYYGRSVRAVSTEKSTGKFYPVARAIDLGLPSGTKWANWNIGASAPEDYGGYYAWGETEEKDHYFWSNYLHCLYTGSESDLFCYYLGDDIAVTQYDVAHVKWGGSWRMPSRKQIKELIDYCSQTRTTRNGVNGTLFTSQNGNSIFLPDAGFRDEDDDNEYLSGYYWSSSGYEGNDISSAYYFSLSSSGSNCYTDINRCYGLSVRPVIQE